MNVNKKEQVKKTMNEVRQEYNNDFLRIGIYVRVSTEEQAKEGYSIKGQIEKLKNYCKIMGWNIYDVYADEGISGKNITARPEVNRLIGDIETKKVNGVLVFKVDRLTRSTRDLIDLVEIFNKNKCAFISLMESIDTKTAAGRMFLKIVGIFAEFERENIIERVRVGFETKVKEGYSLCSFISSYGYDRPKGQKIQTVNEEEARIVREIFRLYVEEDKSLSNIAKILNEKNITTKRESFWNAKTVQLVIQNPNYIGNVRYSCNDKDRYFETKGKHDAIITEELFERANLKIEKRRVTNRTKRPKEENYFSGILYCGDCGRKLATHGMYKKLKDGSTHFIPSYRCYAKMNKVCNAKDMSHKKVEQAFIKYLDRIANLNVVEEIPLNEEHKQKQKALMEEKETIENNLYKIEKKAKEYIENYLNDNLNFETYTQLNQATNQKREELLIRLEEVERNLSENHPVLFDEDIITNIKENWQYLNNQEKMQFTHEFIEKIVAINEQVPNKIYGNVKIKEVKFFEK